MKKNTSGRLAAIAVALALACGGAAWAHEGHKHDTAESKGPAKSDTAESKGAVKKTVTGEIVDLSCYAAHEGKGPKHAVCAKECVLGGAPIGLLAGDGKVYLLLDNHSKAKAKKPYLEARTKVAETVTITGDFYDRGGVPAIVVNEVSAGIMEK